MPKFQEAQAVKRNFDSAALDIVYWSIKWKYYSAYRFRLESLGLLMHCTRVTDFSLSSKQVCLSLSILDLAFLSFDLEITFLALSLTHLHYLSFSSWSTYSIDSDDLRCSFFCLHDITSRRSS